MKGNDGTGNNVSRDDWETPSPLFTALNKQYKFTFDCCASKENTKCSEWTSDFKTSNFWFIKSDHVCWMNPPFSKETEMFRRFFETVKKGVAIYRCDNMETKVWQMILKNCSWIHIFPSRINYEGHKGSGARFPSALIGFNVKPPNKELITGITLFT